MYKVSLIIPVYNGEEFIEKALKSIPEREDIEVIIINDGSTDGTLEKCKEWGKLTKLTSYLGGTNSPCIA